MRAGDGADAASARARRRSHAAVRTAERLRSPIRYVLRERFQNGKCETIGGYLGGCAEAVSSIAEALRCRAVGRCASQQQTEQNISLIRPELQVDTEQRQYFDPS